MNEFERTFNEITGLKFSEFYRIYRPKLIWHLARWTKDLEIAEDYADEAFIQALNKIDTFNRGKGAQVHTWLFTIGDNLVKKDFREKQRMPSVSMNKEYAEHSTLASFIPYDDGSNNFETNQIIGKKADLIKKTIHDLPKKQEKYKTVLVMRELENMTYNDIAEELALNLSTIKSQIKKGRDIIVKKVEKRFKNIDENGLV